MLPAPVRIARALGQQDSEVHVSMVLSSALLTDMSEVALVQLGEDPLSRFDTPVLFQRRGRCEAFFDENEGVIVITEPFVQAIEFMGAYASLVNMFGKIQASSAQSVDARQLRDAVASAREAIHSITMSWLLLHLAGERPAPLVVQSLPKRYHLFVHAQIALSLIFILLHEQAHAEFQADPTLVTLEPMEGEVFADVPDTPDAVEEFAADLWAVRQVNGDSRSRLVKSACFFFFNQWVMDYVLHDSAGSGHPPGFNRIQRLASVVPELQGYDPVFTSIMISRLNEQVLMRDAFAEKGRAARFSALLRYARDMSGFGGYEKMVEFVGLAYRELGFQE